MKSFLVVLPKNSTHVNNQNKKRSATSAQLLESSSVSHSVPSSQASKQRKLVQHFLDIGQKNFGLPITCPKCQFLYVADDEEDIARHRKHCSEVHKIVKLWISV